MSLQRLPLNPAGERLEALLRQRIVFLDGTKDMIGKRLAARKGHFMPPGLLDSQFKTLESPRLDERPITVSIDASVDGIVDDIVCQLELVAP